MIAIECCPHGKDPVTCGDCQSVCLTPHDFFSLFNCVWALGYALSPDDMPVERDVAKRCHNEMVEIVLRYADRFTNVADAHARYS